MARPIRKRRNIEQGVVELVARNGLHATTVQDIAAVAGVSPGLLYRYWKSRDDLAAEVYREHYVQLVRRLLARVTPAQSPRTALVAMIREFLAFADAEPTLLRFLLFSQHDLSPTVPAEEGIRAIVNRFLQAGVAAGEWRPLETDLAFQFVLGLVIQPVVGIIYGDLQGPAARYADEICAMLERVLGVEAAAANPVRLRP